MTTPQELVFDDKDLVHLKEWLKDEDYSGLITWDPGKTQKLKALLARLEAAEACLWDVWHSSIDDKKLEAWQKAKGE